MSLERLPLKTAPVSPAFRIAQIVLLCWTLKNFASSVLDSHRRLAFIAEEVPCKQDLVAECEDGLEVGVLREPLKSRVENSCRPFWMNRTGFHQGRSCVHLCPTAIRRL